MRPVLDVDVGGVVGSLPLDIKLRVMPGETLALVGPNGAGKTSVLRLILGALRPTRGQITIHGRTLVDVGRRCQLPPEDRGMGYVPQDYALFPHRTVLQNVAFGLECQAAAGRIRLSRREIRGRAYHWLQAMEVPHLANRRPAFLSGGEQQRVAMARALAGEPDALLLDEPTAALDLVAQRQLRQFMTGLLKQLNVPVIIVTHDPADAAALSSRLAVMEAGRIVQMADLTELKRDPATPFVAEFARQAAALR